MPKTLATRLTAQGQRHVRAGHPWVYSDSVEQVKGDGQAGDLAVIFDRRRDSFVAVGLYDPASPIPIKVLHAGKPARIDAAFFTECVGRAFAKRASLIAGEDDDRPTTAYRLLNGENDGFPGLIADVYEHVLVLKVYTPAWAPWLEHVQAALVEASRATTVVLRLSRRVQTDAAKPDHWRDGAVLLGELPDPTVVFREHGVRLAANVLLGHKTGFFLDHRAGRRRVGELAAGRRVLDVFSYAGGFAVHALVGGASDVTCVDISAHALELARANAALNVADADARLTTVAEDAFAALARFARDGDRFGLVIVDPPSFAKSAREVPGALQAYRRLTRAALPLVADGGGILVLASCSARVPAEEFFALQDEELRASGRAFEVFDRTGHDVDHPVGFREGAYLKTMWVRLL